MLYFKKLRNYINKTYNSNIKNKCGCDNEISREIWLKLELKNIPNGLRILDAGAGELQYKKYCSHLDYVSQDFAQYDGTGNNSGLHTKTWDNSKLDIISDINNIPLSDKSVDAIMCIEVFEHLPEPIRAIQEFSRLLKLDGILLLTAPFCSLTHFAPYHYYSGFNKYFYEKHLKENGFAIEEIVHNGNYFEYIAQEIRRIPDIGLKYTGYNHSELHSSINSILGHLHKMSETDIKSSELLCFGYHIKARRI